MLYIHCVILSLRLMRLSWLRYHIGAIRKNDHLITSPFGMLRIYLMIVSAKLIHCFAYSFTLIQRIDVGDGMLA